jgi:Spy/CpxP family protein refolding chaperone
MKPNTLKMLAMFLLALAVTAPGASMAAGATGDQKDPGNRAERMHARLVKKLDLTKDQDEKLTALRTKHQEKLKALFEERKGLLKNLAGLVKSAAKDAELTPKLKALDANWKAIQSENDSFQDAGRKILTPMQQAKFHLWLAKQARKEMKTRLLQRRHPNGDDE